MTFIKFIILFPIFSKSTFPGEVRLLLTDRPTFEFMLEKVEAYAEHILKEELAENLTYHNYKHTKGVVKAAKKIGEGSGLNEEQMEMLLIAAWFHDTGFKSKYQGHEEESKKIAEEFLTQHNYPKDRIKKVKALIEATRMPQRPHDVSEQALCDADSAHFAKDSYFKKAEGLRKEWEVYLGEGLTDIEWHEMNLRFLETHRYFTPYARKELGPGKEENIKRQRKLLKSLKREEDKALADAMNLDEKRVKKLKEKLKEVERRPDRGIETMFRLTSRNHIALSSMADNKANIMISVNSIIMTVLISALVPKLDKNTHLFIPTFVMIGMNLISVIFAILATRPNITKGVFTREGIRNKQTNLLFFGNFHKMNRGDYQWGMKQMLEDADYLYSSLIDDIYFLGVVLGKKYRFLRISYTVFMFGLIFTVVTYVIINLFFLN